MARTKRAPQLETRTQRLKLARAKRPYWTAIGKGVSLGYRRNKSFGTWNVRCSKPGGHWSQVIGDADDFAEANGATVLNYWQAADKARSLGLSARHGGSGGELQTVAEALAAYEVELRLHGRDVGNATRVRVYLPATLGKKPVATLTFQDFVPWRDTLTDAGMKPAAINRSNAGLRAALNLAAKRDARITSAGVWGQALTSIPGASEARNVVIAEDKIRAIITAAYELIGEEFGLLVEVAAESGARISQIARLQVRDLQADRADPRLMMPLSRKGKRASLKIERRPVPIPASLATRLQAATAGRPADAPLLVKPAGEPWQKSNHSDPFATAVSAAGLDPAEVTAYALRHSSITRQLLAGVPPRLVAALHDTSVRILEANYSHCIADHGDTIARRALIDVSAPPGGNVVRLGERKS
jgi:integrase